MFIITNFIQSSNALIANMNVLIADLNVLTHKELHIHLFAKGRSFFTIHNETRNDFKFTFQTVDDVQERLLSIHGTPVCSFKQYLELATLKENLKPDLPLDTMLEELIADFKHIRDQLNTIIELAESVNDNATSDLCISLVNYFDERIWQYSSFLAS